MYKRIITSNSGPPNNCIITVHETDTGCRCIRFVVRSDISQILGDSMFTLHECLHDDVHILTSDKLLDVRRGRL